MSLESGTIAGLVKLSSAPADSYLEVTYALAEPELLSPTDAAVTSATPTLVARAIGVPTGTTVSYQFRLSSDSNGNTGALVTSPWSISPSWTVPVGVLADASSYTWRVGVAISPTESRWSSTSRRIRVELRLGIQPTMAYDRHGPFAVNLTNGNLLTTVSGPRFATRAGGLGANLTYSSQGPPIYGLRGRYWRAPCNTASDFTATVPTFVRHDPVVSFSWNVGQLQGPGMAPPPGSAPTRCAAWDGHIRTPGPVTLAVNASDGVRVFIDDNPTPVIDAWSDSVTPRTVTGPLINPGSDGAAIRVEHYDRDGADAISLATMDGGVAVSVPSTWLSPSATNPLPQGWTFDLGGVGLSAQLGSGSVGLGGTEGSTRRHDVAGSPANSWDPTVSYVLKPGDDTALGYAIDNATGDTQMLASGPGGVAIYDHSGRLASVRTAADDGAVVSPIYSWSAEGTLGSVTDPPSGREIALDYGGGDCPSPPAGFDAPSPARMLCRIRYWDSTTTELAYQAGRLALVVNPGGAKTYLGYELVGTNVVMTTLRDGLGSDAADALGGAFATEAGRWLVNYGTGGDRVASISSPVPNPGTASSRLVHRYAVGVAESTVDIDGLSSTARRVGFDSEGRTASDTDATGVRTATTWNTAFEVPVIVTTAADTAQARSTTTILDGRGRAITTYGPAAASCFAGVSPTAACASAVAQRSVALDEGLSGLAGSWRGTRSGTPGVACAH
ncbi:MAG: hypothetical protein ACRDY5_06410, partial [Acidimicrobiales bacterium]